MGTKGYRMNDIEDAVMTVQEVSQYLRLAESTIYKLAQEGKLSAKEAAAAVVRLGIDPEKAEPLEK